MSFESSIEQLRKVYSDDSTFQSEINSLYKSRKALDAKDHFLHNDGARILKEQLEKMERKLSTLLGEDDGTLGEVQRAKVFGRRQAYRWLINTLDPEKTADKIRETDEFVQSRIKDRQ